MNLQQCFDPRHKYKFIAGVGFELMYIKLCTHPPWLLGRWSDEVRYSFVSDLAPSVHHNL